MVKFSKSAQKTLNKLEEGRIVRIEYDEVNNDVGIWELCDEYFVQALNKKDCLNLAEVFLKLAKTIDKNAPKAGKIKVVEVEKEVQVEDKLKFLYVARVLGYEGDVITDGGTIGTFITKEDLIDSLSHNGYLLDENGEYVKNFEDGRKHSALIEVLEIHRK